MCATILTMPIAYATTNKDKFNKAVENLQPFGIELEQISLELDEPQSWDSELIVRTKAEQAYQIVQRPVLVGDDAWSIPALKGFPATNMKQCNHFLVADDWLRLMKGVADRRIYLIAYLAFADGNELRVTHYQQEAYFLETQQGVHATAPHLSVIAWKDETRSVAEMIAAGVGAHEQKPEVWREVATWVRDR